MFVCFYAIQNPNSKQMLAFSVGWKTDKRNRKLVFENRNSTESNDYRWLNFGPECELFLFAHSNKCAMGAKNMSNFSFATNEMNERKQNRVNKPLFFPRCQSMCDFRVHCPLFQMLSSLLLINWFATFVWSMIFYSNWAVFMGSSVTHSAGSMGDRAQVHTFVHSQLLIMVTLQRHPSRQSDRDSKMQEQREQLKKNVIRNRARASVRVCICIKSQIFRWYSLQWLNFNWCDVPRSFAVE